MQWLITSGTPWWRYMNNISCMYIRDHFVHAPNQWETMLHCNIVSRWLVDGTEAMTMSWHGNVFHITGPLVMNPRVNGGFPSLRAQLCEALFSLLLTWTGFWKNSWVACEWNAPWGKHTNQELFMCMAFIPCSHDANQFGCDSNLTPKWLGNFFEKCYFIS